MRITMLSPWHILLFFVFLLMICTSYYALLPLFLNFYIVRRLRVCWRLCYNSEVILSEEKHLPVHLWKELQVYAVFICFSCFSYYFTLIIRNFKQFDDFYNGCPDFVQGNAQIFIITLLIWTGIFFLKKLTDSEIRHLSSVNNLTLGYGAAIWYYRNYLDRILPENFTEKVRQYESREKVELPLILYILCPKSCKVKKYIDSTDCIELSGDLPPYEIDHGGIAGRKYCISVYRIKSNGQFFRCGLEYAQPLKTLLALKENGRISLSDLYTTRESFINHLTHMLRDPKNSFEVCELVEYDDENQELHEILSGLKSVQPFKRKTGE